MTLLSHRKTALLALGALIAGCAFAAPAAHAQTVIGGQLFVTNTGNVTATFQGSSASFSDDLLLFSPANNLGVIFNNQTTPIGTTKDLGMFNAGDELIFQIHVNNTGDNFFTGPGVRNSDGQAHARVTYNYSPTETLVEFEDLAGGPFNYNDLSFTFTNLQATATVPEPSEYAMGGMLGASLLFGMVRAKRRTAKKAPATA